MAKIEETTKLPSLDELLKGELNEEQKAFVAVLDAYKKKNPAKYAVKENEYITKLLKLA